MRYEIKALGVGGVLDHAINLVRDNLRLLVGVVLVLQFPFALLTGLLVMPTIPDPQLLQAPETVPVYWDQYFQMMTRALLLAIPSVLIVWPLTNAAVIHGVACLYLDKPISVGGAYRRAFQVWLPTIWTGLLWYFSMLGGFILCLIPGILCMFWFALVLQIVVLEGTSGFGALTRSRQLMKGNMSEYFVLVILLFAIAAGVGMVSGLIPQIQLRVVVNTFFQSALFILASAAYVVFYFSCRCKHENFDLQLLAASVGEGVPIEAGPDMSTDTERTP